MKDVETLNEFCCLAKQMNDYAKEGKYEEAFKLSVELADLCGVPKEKILRTEEDIDKFFLGK